MNNIRTLAVFLLVSTVLAYPIAKTPWRPKERQFSSSKGLDVNGASGTTIPWSSLHTSGHEFAFTQTTDGLCKSTVYNYCVS